jgi:hypothetical protein
MPGDARAALSDFQRTGQLPAAVPDRLAIPVGLSRQRDRVPGDLARVQLAESQPDLQTAGTEQCERADPQLKHLVNGDVLPSVSRRDPVRHTVTVWTTSNRVFGCRSPRLLADIAVALASAESVTGPARTVLGRPPDATEHVRIRQPVGQPREHVPMPGANHDREHRRHTIIAAGQSAPLAPRHRSRVGRSAAAAPGRRNLFALGRADRAVPCRRASCMYATMIQVRHVRALPGAGVPQERPSWLGAARLGPLSACAAMTRLRLPSSLSRVRSAPARPPSPRRCPSTPDGRALHTVTLFATRMASWVCAQSCGGTAEH